MRTASIRLFVLLLAVTVLTSCQIGPRLLPSSAAHYSDAVRVAQSEELLVNLVRLRYRDLPVFLAVTSISTQFEFGANASVGGVLPEGDDDVLDLGLGAEYSERPTVTFGVLNGSSFEREMLEPIRMNTIALLVESGWRADRVLRLTVEGLNGVSHAGTASGPTPTREPEFRDFQRAMRLLRDLVDRGSARLDFEYREQTISDPIPRSQISGDDLIVAAKAGIKFKRSAVDSEYEPYLEERRLVLRFLPAATEDPAAADFRELLRLDPSLDAVDIVTLDQTSTASRAPGERYTELVCDTRSLQGVLYFLSHAVEATAEELDTGVVTKTMRASGEPFDWNDLFDGLFRVASTNSRPKGAPLAVRHRDRWFSVDGSDQSSRSTLLLLRHLFTLQSGERASVKPVLTLPVGQ